MTLPKFNTIPSWVLKCEPIFKNLFEITIKSENLLKNELNKLNYYVIGITHNILTFNVNEDHEVTKALLKIKKFSLKINSYDKNGHIIGIYLINGCKIKNIEKYILDFNYNSSDILEYIIPFKYKKIKFFKYQEYIRKQKVKRILKN